MRSAVSCLVAGLLFASSALLAADRPKLMGNVFDLEGKPVVGAVVQFNHPNLTDTTDQFGRWSFGVWQVNVDGPARISGQSVGWNGNILEFDLDISAMVSVDAFDVRGSRVAYIGPQRLPAGISKIPFALTASRMGFVWLRVTVNGRSDVVYSGSKGWLGRRVHPDVAARSQSYYAGDSLTVKWREKRLVRKAITMDTAGIAFIIDTLWKDDAGIAWDPDIGYGSLRDERDGQTYRTIQVNGVVWMAQNLNFEVDSSWWYSGCINTPSGCVSMGTDEDNGLLYGRLYNWAAALNLPDSCNTHRCVPMDTCMSPDCFESHQGICPEGWHVPLEREWSRLVAASAALSKISPLAAGAGLKSEEGWAGCWVSGIGPGWTKPTRNLDVIGARVLPSGSRIQARNVFQDAGFLGDTWTRTEWSEKKARYKSFGGNADNVWTDSILKTTALALRCVRNTPAPVVLDSSKIVPPKDSVWSQFPLDTAVSTPPMTDSRDGQVYRTIGIGGKTWMAQNLNYATEGSWWHVGYDSTLQDSIDENLTQGAKYGRYYNWESAQAACPRGWHLPSYTEWDDLIEYVYEKAQGKMHPAQMLMSKTGWYNVGQGWEGLDLYGFGVLPGRVRNSDGVFNGAGVNAYFWSSSSQNETRGVYTYFRVNYPTIDQPTAPNSYAMNIRCLMD